MNSISKKTAILRHITGWLFLFCSMWLVCTILFAIRYQRPALWAFFVSFAIDYAVNARWKDWKWTPAKWIYISWIVYFALIPIYHWCYDTDTTFIYRHQFNYCLPFLGVGIMGLLGIGKQIRLPYIAYAFVITSVCAIGYIVGQVPYETIHSATDFAILFNAIRTTHISPHMLFNLYLNSSLLMGLYILRNKSIGQIQKTATGIAVLIIFATLCISDGRIGFATANAIIVGFLLIEIWNRLRRYFVPTVVIMLAIFCSAVLLHPRIGDSLNDPRQYIWDTTNKTISEQPLLGCGIAKGRSHFIENGLSDTKFTTFYSNPYLAEQNTNINMMHPHNAMLDAWLCFGILGFLLMLFILVFPFIVFAMQRNIYGCGFAFAFAMQAMFESWGSDLMPLLYTLGILWIYAGFTNYANTEIKD